eukprot:296530-Chlamydomonas_euryale.AAC.3
MALHGRPWHGNAKLVFAWHCMAALCMHVRGHRLHGAAWPPFALSWKPALATSSLAPTPHTYPAAAYSLQDNTRAIRKGRVSVVARTASRRRLRVCRMHQRSRQQRRHEHQQPSA